MAKVKVMIRNNQREVKIPVGLRLLVRKCCQAVLTTEKFPGAAEVSVSFVPVKFIHIIGILSLFSIYIIYSTAKFYSFIINIQ